MLLARTHDAPNWIDLSTPDPEGAARFYGELFGWAIETTGGPFGPYRVGHAGDHEVGGIMAPPPGEAAAPSAWTLFVHVADVDRTLERVVSAGGTVLQPAIDLPDGQVAVVADPGGAMFGVITGREPEGVWLASDPGAVCWVELLTRDVEAVEPFYTDVFGWKPVTVETPGGPYTTFWLEGDQVGGMMPMPETVPAAAPSYWAVYLAVDDCERVARRAAELGGQVLHPPTVAGDVRFAVLADPTGAPFSVMVPLTPPEP